MSTEEEKAALGAKTLQEFFGQFATPGDVVGQAFLEVLIEELMNEKTVRLSGQSEQVGDQAHHDPQRGTSGEFNIGRSEQTETPTGLGTTDPEDHS
jgi:hypothetical protein